MGASNLSANSRNIKKFNLQQKAKTILFIALIVVPVLIGFIAYGFYKNATKDPNSAQLIEENSVIDEDSYQQIPEDTLPEQTTPSDSQASQPNTSSQSELDQPVANTPAAPANGLPEGVSVAINSLESSGIKGNPYVSNSLDTSMVPDGASIKIDRNSWTQYGSDIGVVKGSVIVNGENKSGSLTFTKTNNSWLVSGFGLDE